MLLSRSPLLSRLVSRLVDGLPSRVPLRGRRAVPGLGSDVRVSWTEGGLPHLHASNEADLFFAQGYVTATERAFQLDLVRRTARGELAEIFGARPAPWRDLTVIFRGMSLVDLDLFMRELALVSSAKASLDALSSDARSLVDAYAAGVSAALAEGSRPLECQLLQYRPRAWTAVDSMVVWKALAFQLSYGWRAGLAAEALRAKFPDHPEKARALLPDQRAVSDVMLPVWPGASRALPIIETAAGKRGPSGPALGGSNAWALAPKRTKNGRAIVCGDPHLPLRAPNAGYLVHLAGGRFDVAGFSIPGVPGVILGHNARVAWSITSGCTLDATWAMEQLSTSGDEVRTAAGFEPLREEPVELIVRGQKAPLRRRVRHGPNGPVFDGRLLGETPERHAISLRWIGHLGTPDVEALLDMNRAGSLDEMRATRAKFGSPPVNVVAADLDGHVGWQLAGLAPKFRGRPPRGAVPGWAPEHEWDGLESIDTLPSLTDPPDGLVVSANQKLFPSTAPVQLGELFEPPFRARRIRQRLEAMPQATLDDAQSVQEDRLSGFGVAFQQRFLRSLAARLLASKDRPTGGSAQVLAHALDWDGASEGDSAGAAATWTFVRALARGAFEPLLGEPLFVSVFEQYSLPLLPLLRVLEADGAPFFSRTELDELATRALGDAFSILRARCGANPRRWRFDAFAVASFRHPMSDIPALGRLVTVGPFPHAGDGTTVNAAFSPLTADGRVEVAPVFRHAVEVGDWDGYRVVLAGGQSGDPTSPRYRDHTARWREGRWFTLPFSSDAVAQAEESAALLVPGTGR